MKRTARTHRQSRSPCDRAACFGHGPKINNDSCCKWRISNQIESATSWLMAIVISLSWLVRLKKRDKRLKHDKWRYLRRASIIASFSLCKKKWLPYAPSDAHRRSSGLENQQTCRTSSDDILVCDLGGMEHGKTSPEIPHAKPARNRYANQFAKMI
jgi:hypothetical protein